MRIATLYICTGEYVAFWKEFYLSMEQKFLPKTVKEYFVFTDAHSVFGEEEDPNIHRIYQDNLGWPGNTLFRFRIFATIIDRLKQFDYIFFMNANMICIEEVGEDILPVREDLLMVQHPGAFDRSPYQFPYDRHTQSKAYIPYNMGMVYVCGGINGGKADAYIRLILELRDRIEDDYARGVVAKWHDESHLNKYILEDTNYKLLSPGYCYPEGWDIPYHPVMMVRDKGSVIDVKQIKMRKKYDLSWYNIKNRMMCLYYSWKGRKEKVMMQDSPLVTITIPSYNHEKYIEDCIKSVYAQTYHNIEIIIIDDCSGDHTYELLQKWLPKLSQRFTRVSLIRNEQNQGVTKTLNKAIAQGMGQYYYLMASDDLLLTDAICNLVQYFESHPEYAVITSNVLIGDDSTTFREDQNYACKRWYQTPPKKGKKLFYSLLKENYIIAQGTFLSAETLIKYGVFDETVKIEDWEYWLRISTTGSMGYLDEFTAIYRLHDNSITHYHYSKDGECKYILIMKSELCIIDKYSHQAGISGIRKRYKYCFWKVISASKERYTEALECLWDYLRAYNTIFYVMMKSICKLIQWSIKNE